MKAREREENRGPLIFGEGRRGVFALIRVKHCEKRRSEGKRDGRK